MTWGQKTQNNFRSDKPKNLRVPGVHVVRITKVTEQLSKKSMPQLAIEMATSTGEVVGFWATKGVPRSEEEYTKLCLVTGATASDPQSLVGKQVQIDTQISFLNITEFMPTAQTSAPKSSWGPSNSPSPPPSADPWGVPPPMDDSDKINF